MRSGFRFSIPTVSVILSIEHLTSSPDLSVTALSLAVPEMAAMTAVTTASNPQITVTPDTEMEPEQGCDRAAWVGTGRTGFLPSRPRHQPGRQTHKHRAGRESAWPRGPALHLPACRQGPFFSCLSFLIGEGTCCWENYTDVCRVWSTAGGGTGRAALREVPGQDD